MTNELMRCFLPLTAAVVLICQAPTTAASDVADGRAQPRRILLDTDPGGDDVFALLWLQSLAKQGRAEIVAVTTVGGNVESQHTFANACKILALGGFGQIEVGRSAPVRGRVKDAAHIHGADGMGNLSQTLPAPKHQLNRARYAHHLIIEKLSAAPGEITLVAIGPLTSFCCGRSTGWPAAERSDAPDRGILGLHCAEPPATLTFRLSARGTI